MSKLQKVQGQPKFYEQEKETLKWWKEKNILDRSIDQRSDSKVKTFYDGPITANGMPHHGHMLTFAMKDLMPRYWTMQGYKVDRSLGWDCQGIPVEYEVEKKLGFKEKKDIVKFGIAKFNQLCRESVMQYRGAMIDLEEKMGRLTNDREEYATMDPAFIESIWWSLKELYNKDLLYEGFKVVPYSTRAGTTLSNAEVALGGYKKFVDPAVTVKFELEDEPGTFVLAWTTTPWTLPTNFALAINKEIEYVKVEQNGEKYILAKKCVETYFPKGTKTTKVDRKSLYGKKYKPLFDFFIGRKNCFQIVEGFHVTTDSGTGVVHMAPYGAEDNEIFKENDIESIDVLNDQGDFTDKIPLYSGMNYRDANPKIVEYLKEHNLLFKYEDYEHDMPMCWRTNTPLIYKPVTSWYIAMSKLRERLVALNNTINWTPKHIKEGRFGNWLAEIKDWGISRFRYWGTPLPIWKSKSGKVLILESFAEVKKYSGVDITDPHRPFIDEIEFDHEGEHYTRIPDVLDVWYDSGAMPFARFHYPFENEKKFEKKFPAQFIAEGLDQTRGWFYTLHALSTALFDSVSFENVVVNGFVLDDNGQKLSKSKKNYTEPDKMIEMFGADAIRLNFFQSPILAGEDTTISDKTVKLTTQEMVLPLWNIFSYICTYAQLHNWDSDEKAIHDYVKAENKNALDQWLLIVLQDSTNKVISALDKYEIPKATGELKNLLDNISKWYIRRARNRFAEGDLNALNTLYYVYVQTLKLFAPFAPFITEFVYQRLVVNASYENLESIHLGDYPIVRKLSEKELSLLNGMQQVRELATAGLEIRDREKIKLRQPLAQFKINIELPEELQEILAEEMNVEKVSVDKKLKEVELETELSDDLRLKGNYRELVRAVQDLRKKSGMQAGEKIMLSWNADGMFKEVFEKMEEELKKSVLAQEVNFEKLLEQNTTLNGEKLGLAVAKED